MIDTQELRRSVERAVATATRIRHDIHQHPEIAFEEHRTVRVVQERLRELGLDATPLAETGAVAVITGGQPGPVVALRADMDALPIAEATGAAYASETPGRMHACGHDGHTACLLGAAEVLMAHREALAGSVKLIFQPAEERASGAARMIVEGVLTDPEPEVIFALHAWPDLNAGQIGLRPGALLAAVDTFEVTLRGRGGHGAHPHGCVDPILLAARVVDALQGVVSREVNPLEPAVVTIGSIHGGTAPNIIPDEVILQGTARTLSSETEDLVQDALIRLIEGTAVAHGGSAAIAYHREVPVTYNDERVTAFLFALGRELLGPENVVEVAHPSMGGEDFSLYLERVPGAFFRLGVGPGRPTLHSSQFDFNDDALATGILILSAAALRWKT